MRSELLSELATIGYEISLEGDQVKFRYMKSDDPPESVRPLIDELRTCKAEVVSILKRKRIPPAKTRVIWRNPHPQGTLEARKESLRQCMTATWETAREDAMQKQPEGYELTKPVLEAEDKVTETYHRVLSGNALLDDFRMAVERWTLAVQDAPKKSGNCSRS